MSVKSKKASPLTVQLAANTLILAKGCTTTLDVKLFLRKRGYRAFQGDISKWMYALAPQEGWAVNDNGLFRIYYFPQLRPIPQ